MCEEDVEADREKDEEEDHESCFPQSDHLCVWIDKEHHFLHDTSELKATRWNSSDPAKAATPADDVRETLLETSGCEFADLWIQASVIAPSVSWSQGPPNDTAHPRLAPYLTEKSTTFYLRGRRNTELTDREHGVSSLIIEYFLKT